MGTSNSPQFPNDNNQPAPARTAQILTDELGISIKANLRLPRVQAVVDAFAMKPTEEHAALLENIVVLGATTAITTAEITATDVVQTKLLQVAETMHAAQQTMLERQNAQIKNETEHFDAAIRSIRTQLADNAKQDNVLRKELRDAQTEVIKASDKLNLARAELEKRVLESIAQLNSSQVTARDAMAKATEEAVRKLMDKTNPTSAPALIAGVMDRAAADMRAETSRNLDTMMKDLSKQFGENSPLINKLAKTVREGAEAEIKHATDQVSKLREDLLKSRTRQDHSPYLIGNGYEEQLFEILSPGAVVYGSTVDRTGNEVGTIAGSKKGDHLIVDEHNVPIAAIEARARKGVSGRAFNQGLLDTAKNRNTKIVVYLARTTEDLPTGLGEFSRGHMPFHYRQLSDGIHAITAVIDPSAETGVERLAMILWLVHHLHQDLPEHDGQADAATRMAQATPWLQQLVGRLAMFTTIKSGLTKSAGEIGKVRDTVTTLEAALSEDLKRLQEILDGDEPSAVLPHTEAA